MRVHLLPLLLFVIDATFGLEHVQHHEYCIIGAGPSGLQLAYFLHRAKHDYVIYERNSHAGSFYTDYPRHRRLISINKRNTGERNRKFNLRHDWNSLLADDDRLRFTHRSKQLFPSADIMVEYLNDFYRHNQLHVQFNTTISNLRPSPADSCQARECPSSSTNNELIRRFRMNDQHGKQYTCGSLHSFVSNERLFVPNVPPIDGIDLAHGYENLSLKVEEFENKSILILGRGNAAFEVAQHIYDVTSFIHMVSRSRVRNAYATHYVGDLRAINNQLLDTYQLKSLDGLLELDLVEHELYRRPSDGRIQLQAKESAAMGSVHERQESTIYDKVIRCLGFKFDNSIWHSDVQTSKNLGRAVKFPKIRYDYQSSDHDHLYYAGVVTHSLDFRKSSGGFIHGFRYTAQALHRILEHRYHEREWPSTLVPWSGLTNYLIKRMNEADGIYQMFGQLVDVILIDRMKRQCRYIEEFPARLLPRLEEITGWSSNDLFVLNMQYGSNYSGPGRDVFAFDRAFASVTTADQSNFLHPVLHHYDSPLQETDFVGVKSGQLPLLPSVRIHHTVENLLTSWTNPDEHILPLRVFLENVLRVNLQQRTAASYARQKLLQQKVTIPSHLYAAHLRE